MQDLNHPPVKKNIRNSFINTGSNKIVATIFLIFNIVPGIRNNKPGGSQ